jgi:hypothetical protein
MMWLIWLISNIDQLIYEIGCSSPTVKFHMSCCQVYYHHYLRVLHYHMQFYQITLHVTSTFLYPLRNRRRRRKAIKELESEVLPAAGVVVLARKGGWRVAAVTAVTLVLVQPW